jgi:D-glucuronyl C5-epimerase-like protein
MGRTHLQSPLYDLAAGRGGFIFVRVPLVRLMVLALILSGALAGALAAPAIGASRVLVMDRTGHVRARVDRALAPEQALPAPAGPPAALAAAPKRRKPAERTVRGELARLLHSHQIGAAAYARDRAIFDAAVRTARRLSGTRRAELQGFIGTLHGIAARGQLTAGRLPELFMTLDRNRQWWSSGPLLSYGQRVEFSDSRLVWEDYPGQGIQLQVLGTFGKANGLWMAHDDVQLRALLDEMVSLAVRRGGSLAWEYDFAFGGGLPPWTSAMSQATGIQALSRASQRLGQQSYLHVARQALGIFSQAPPVGVRVTTPLGARYLLYSFAPGQIVVNGFIQTLVGLWDYAQIASDPAAGRLFRAGDRQARRDVVADNTGAWSLYQLGGAESDLSYHELLQGFLKNLCDRTSTAVYCTTADDYAQDLHEPAATSVLTHRVKAGKTILVRFRLSKVSRVGMTIRHDDGVVFQTSASIARGVHGYAWKVPKTPGTYDVTLTSTDLAGNNGRTTDTIEVLGG